MIVSWRNYDLFAIAYLIIKVSAEIKAIGVERNCGAHKKSPFTVILPQKGVNLYIIYYVIASSIGIGLLTVVSKPSALRDFHIGERCRE